MENTAIDVKTKLLVKEIVATSGEIDYSGNHKNLRVKDARHTADERNGTKEMLFLLTRFGVTEVVDSLHDKCLHAASHSSWKSGKASKQKDNCLLHPKSTVGSKSGTEESSHPAAVGDKVNFLEFKVRTEQYG